LNTLKTRSMSSLIATATCNLDRCTSSKPLLFLSFQIFHQQYSRMPAVLRTLPTLALVALLSSHSAGPWLDKHDVAFPLKPNHTQMCQYTSLAKAQLIRMCFASSGSASQRGQCWLRWIPFKERLSGVRIFWCSEVHLKIFTLGSTLAFQSLAVWNGGWEPLN
jgi:hypothetical protein